MSGFRNAEESVPLLRDRSEDNGGSLNPERESGSVIRAHEDDEQDDDPQVALQQLSHSLTRLRSVGESISGELDAQGQMLDDLNRDMDFVNPRLARNNRIATRVHTDADRSSCLLCIVLLLLMMIVAVYCLSVIVDKLKTKS
eukprot:ANDGO_00184.mRNA.1 hypothetical protein